MPAAPNYSNKSMAKPRCCCCSGCLVSIFALVVFGFAKLEHVTPMSSLTTISAYIYSFAQQHFFHKTVDMLPTHAPILHGTPVTDSLPVPAATISSGSDLLPAAQARSRSASNSVMSPDEELPNDVPKGSVNFLEPWNPALKPGDFQLDGILMNDGGNQLTMNALWVTLQGQRRSVFASPCAKIVAIFPSTEITVNHQHETSEAPFLAPASIFNITVVGPLTEAGQAMSAESIDLEPAPSLEVTLMQAMQKASANGGVRGPKSPEVAIEHSEVNVGVESETVQYVRVKAGTYNIKVGIAGGKIGAVDSLSAIAKRYNAVAAINGSFFDCYATGAIKMPDHALISAGRLVSRGGVGTSIGQTPDGEIRFDRTYYTSRWHEFDPTHSDSSTFSDAQDSALFWARTTESLGCGPRLVAGGAVSLSPTSEGFSSAEVLSGVSVRSAVGVSKNGDLILIVTHANLPELAQIMFQLGCRDAMNLDGGASSGLWVRGQSIRTPGRLLSNALVVVGR